jgi:hypothetical protein
MRLAGIGLIGGLGLLAAAGSANAAPVVPNLEHSTNVIQVWGGCGPGWHPSRWGNCRPNRYGYYAPYRYYGRPYYYGGGYYGGGYYGGGYYGGGYYPYRHRYWYGY